MSASAAVALLGSCPPSPSARNPQVDKAEVHEIVSLQFQLAASVPDMHGAAEGGAPKPGSGNGGALVKAQSGVLAAFGGGAHFNKQDLKQEVEKLREWMNDDPRRKALQVALARCPPWQPTLRRQALSLPRRHWRAGSPSDQRLPIPQRDAL